MTGETLLLAIGSALGVGGLVAAALATRPRPRSAREAAYLLLPLAGVVALALLAWSRR